MKNLLIVLLSLTGLTPKPVSEVAVLKNGEPVTCTLDMSQTSLYADKAFTAVAATWLEFIDKGEYKAEISSSLHRRGSDIQLLVNKDLAPEEYILQFGESEVAVYASTPRGAWWGLQSLTQIIIANFNGGYTVRIPAVRIQDKPQFSYRGAHFDCCRHFFTLDEVKKFLDIMSLHKLNTFHWHLTDDQGWRIEIKKYPLLTEIGSIRKETMVGHVKNSKVYDGVPYGRGMYYTQDQIKEIVAYAAARQIDIIPEIEMPGHMVAALAAYPYLGCTGGPYEVWTKWGISRDVLCLGKETSYQFVKDVLEEVCELFPYKYIHIGGDEAPVVKRETCPACQAKMKELGLEKEIQLQGYLIGRVEKFLKSKGREVIGWCEILDAGISKDAIVMSWRGAKGGIKAAQQGNRAVMTPNNYFYLDHYQAADPATEEPLAIGGRNTLERCYSFDPYDQLTDEQKPCIIGIQANTWTEYISTFDHVMHMDLPRFTALAEDSWGSQKDDFPTFKARVVSNYLPLYKFFGYKYAPYEFK